MAAVISWVVILQADRWDEIGFFFVGILVSIVLAVVASAFTLILLTKGQVSLKRATLMWLANAPIFITLYFIWV
ncbi:MAG: hypothetical protein KDC35_10895 [Acidobacteria bacterium]|nr:hypothetical protein [Acidobacteriota bacterium]